MRELTVRIKFTKACLGNVKKYITKGTKKWPCFYMPRTPDGNVRFEVNWWKHSVKFAAEVLCRHQKAVGKIHFDVNVDGKPHSDQDLFYKRYFAAKKFVKHEAFREGEIIGINCLVPNEITDDDFWRLIDLVGRYKGISPYGPREYGFFVVDSIGLRHPHLPNAIDARKVAEELVRTERIEKCQKEFNESNDLQRREPAPDTPDQHQDSAGVAQGPVLHSGEAPSD